MKKADNQLDSGMHKLYFLGVYSVLAVFIFILSTEPAAKRMRIIDTPPPGKIYHGVFPSGKDLEEDAITPRLYHSYKRHAGKRAAWIYFSHNWFNGRRFPTKTATWIRNNGAVPFIRLMLRSSEEQDVRESKFTLGRIIRGKFDKDLRRWARGARKFHTPLLVEYGTEVNGRWFSWNAFWNGRGRKAKYGNPNEYDGPEKFRDAYRHIVDIARSEGAKNITWVYHVNNESRPEKSWNTIAQYYPGDQWVDWIGVSIYGPQSPTAGDYRSFRHMMNAVYPELTALSAVKPIAILEFGAADNNPRFSQAGWANKAIRDLEKFRWRRVIGFSWWNEAWENDDDPAHDSNMRIQDNTNLARVFWRRIGRKIRVLGKPVLIYQDNHWRLLTLTPFDFQSTFDTIRIHCQGCVPLEIK